ncbi:MAG: YdiU family protein [Sphingobacteriales bacterium]|nr:MAG: YdiU family protein [Sphingobacteriales bacterium]
MASVFSSNYTAAFIQAFPGDASGNLLPRQTPGLLWSATSLTPVADPTLLAWSENLARTLGIDQPQTLDEIAVLAGNGLAPGMQPYASCYGGHQFGHWAGQLGDGRAITLGEWTRPDGFPEELQLKGAGPTAYSRRGDGRAVLRSSVREYLMSEAMYHLGIPTTRALSLVQTGDDVVRDLLYDGHPRPEPGAIVLRTAPSLIRFGHFELLYVRKEFELLRQLTDWVIQRYFPHLIGADPVVAFYEELVKRTARLMVDWQRVGFVHGVMNTDNMSILGLTIDYGPYGMLDAYDEAFTPNTTDLPGRRYAFGNQPQIAKWNLANLAGSLVPVVKEPQRLAQALESYDLHFQSGQKAMLRAKLGLSGNEPLSNELLTELPQLLQTVQPDYTLFFQLLETLPMTGSVDATLHFEPALYGELSEPGTRQLQRFVEQYQQCIRSSDSSERTARMQQTNPRFILRNYQLHEAIEALEAGDDTLFRKLEAASQQPYTLLFPELNHQQPQWAQTKPGCGMLSCSS